MFFSSSGKWHKSHANMNEDQVWKTSTARRVVRRLSHQERNNKGPKYIRYGRKCRTHRIRIKKKKKKTHNDNYIFAGSI